MFFDFFFWTALSGFFITGMHWHFIMVDWLWNSVLNPTTSYGWILLLFIISLIIEDDQRIIWPLPALYLYLAWNYQANKEASLFSLLVANWQEVITYTIIYIVIGFIWSMIKLRLFIKDENKYSVKKYYPTGLQTPASFIKKTPEEIVHENKYRIYSWIVYWPFSMIHYVSYDMIVNLYNIFFNNFFKKVYIYIVIKTLNFDDEQKQSPTLTPVPEKGARGRSPTR